MLDVREERKHAGRRLVVLSHWTDLHAAQGWHRLLSDGNYIHVDFFDNLLSLVESMSALMLVVKYKQTALVCLL